MVPAVFPRGFVAVVVQHDGDDAVAVLRVEGDVVPGYVDGDTASVVIVVVVVVEEWRLGKRGEVGG